jgi:MFS transporter, MHS family, proline/betaine transporter
MSRGIRFMTVQAADAAAAATAPSGISRSQWKVIVLSSLGGALEFYDFVVYSMFANYIGRAFFPSSSAMTSQLLSWTVFAVGYLARPLGGVIFSHFGDRYGRRKVFITAMLLMSLSTVSMGLLPGYEKLGITASVLMVCLRLLQGFCLGGELPGAITYVVETAPRTAGFATGFIFFCVNSGVFLASALSLVIHLIFTEEQIAGAGGWGWWRTGFLFGGFLGFISFYLRLSLQETKEFQNLKHSAISKRPLADLLRTQPASVFVAVSTMIATAAFNGLLFAAPSLLPGIIGGYTATEASKAQNICLLLLSFGLITVAWLGDKVPRRYLLMLGSGVLTLFSIPYFQALAEHTTSLWTLALLAGLAASFVNGPMCATAADLFPTRIRFSGVAVSFNLAFSIFSGIAPLTATALVAASGSRAAPGYYMAACALLTLIGTFVLHRFDGRILREQREREQALASAPSSFPAQ